MFLILFDVLQELLLFSDVDEKSSSNHQVSAIGDSLIDVNNNLPTITARNIKQHDFSAGTTKDLGNNRHIIFYKTNECIHKVRRRMIILAIILITVLQI